MFDVDVVSIFIATSPLSTTSNLLSGVVVPIPTFPPEVSVRRLFDPKSTLVPILNLSLSLLSIPIRYPITFGSSKLIPTSPDEY